MPTTPWRQIAVVEPERSYLAMLLRLPLGRLRTIPRFVCRLWQVEDQLRLASGLVGYTLRTKVFAKEFFVLSVWESEAALRRFVIEDPHRQFMHELVGLLGASELQLWTVQGAELPLVFDRELHRLTRR